MAKTVLDVIAWARVQRAGDVEAKSVLLVLAAHSDRHGYSKLSQRTVAAEAEVSQPTASRRLAALAEAGLVSVVRARGGRAEAGYQLAIDQPRSDSPSESQTRPVVIPLGESQEAVSDSSRGIADDDRSDSRGARSDSQADLSDSRRRSDQQVSAHEELPTGVEANYEEAAALLVRERPRARGGRVTEHVPPAELNRTAGRLNASGLVTAWSTANPGVANGHRRELIKAVSDLLAQGGTDPRHIPRALELAHQPHIHHPAKVLGSTYEQARRESMPRAAALADTRTPVTTARVQAALAFLDPEEP